jgi:hypothetical protein
MAWCGARVSDCAVTKGPAANHLCLHELYTHEYGSHVQLVVSQNSQTG